MKNTEVTPKIEMKVKKNFVAGLGRRKTASARVFLYSEKGDFVVNGENISTYFNSEKDQLSWTKPFHLIGVSHPEAKYSATIKVEGSGKSAQLDAVVHGIARALAKENEEFHTILSKASMLTRDSRMVERKKPYLHKARKAPQFSKR